MRKYILAMVAVVVAIHCSAGDGGEGTSRAEQFCAASCKCEGCTEADRSICVSDMDDLGSEANSGQCEDALDGYYDCLEKDAICDEATYDTSTCRTEEKVLSTCINGTSGSGGASSATSSASASGSGGAGPCPYTEDGACDEPEGTNLCPEGTDVVDCGGACITCSAALAGTTTGSLCPASQSLYDALSACACTSTTCSVSCPNFCVGLADTSTCFSCMNTYCTTAFANCSNDF